MTIKIIDRPCGFGKTTQILKSFEEDKKYLVVVPYLTEVDRFISDACVSFNSPTIDDHDSKYESIQDLLINGENIVTTHALYYSLVVMARLGLLDDYHLIIDEVPTIISEGKGVKVKSYKDVYLKGGFLVEDPETGLVSPTEKWEECLNDVDDTLDKTVYNQAKSGCLYRVDGKFFIWLFPSELLTRNLTTSIYTYLAEGSPLLAYLDRLGVSYEHDIDHQSDLEFRGRAKKLIDIKSLDSIDKVKFTATAQGKMPVSTKKQVSGKLKRLRENELQEVNKRDIMVTSLKANWFTKTDTPSGFSKGTGLFNETQWVPNTTRGTNNYNHCHALIYLWDQYINDAHRRFLGMEDFNKSHNQYAISELIQWIYRSRVRNGQPITLYLPSSRMRRLLEDWMDGKDLADDQ